MEEIEKTKEFEEKHGPEKLSCLIFRSFRKSIKKGRPVLDVLVKEIDKHENEE